MDKRNKLNVLYDFEHFFCMHLVRIVSIMPQNPIGFHQPNNSVKYSLCIKTKSYVFRILKAQD